MVNIRGAISAPSIKLQTVKCPNMFFLRQEPGEAGSIREEKCRQDAKQYGNNLRSPF